METDLQGLEEVLQWFSQFQRFLPDPTVWLQCEIALVEIFTNAVRHAHHRCTPETPIEIQVALAHQRLEIQVWDQGAPFDLKRHLQALPEEIDMYQENGRGLKIVQAVADELSYQRHDGRNCFSFIRHFPDRTP